MKDPFGQIFRSQETDERAALVPGLWYAEVDHLDGDGRYVLKWLSGNSKAPSAPARVATLMAGRGRGAFFMPEPGDEVVVGFEEGNFDKPVILGALWSDVDAPPSQADTEDSNNVRTIVSRAGHEITFDDTSNKGGLLVRTSGALEIQLSDDDQSITIRSAGGLEITLSDRDGKLSVKTAPALPATRIELEGVSWFHQHSTGVGPSGPPMSI